MLELLYFCCLYLTVVNIPYSLALNEAGVDELNVLEKEKNELVRQIHDAIDDSMSLLRKENTTQNVEGVKYLLELKQQIEKSNVSETDDVASVEGNSSSGLENRRKMRNLKFPVDIERQLNLNSIKKDKEFDVNRVLFNKKISKEKLNKLMESRLAMQKRLDQWILQREIEKAKIRNRYLTNKRLVQAGLLEKCPRFGFKSNKKKKTRRSRKDGSAGDEKPNKVKRHKKKKKYPCCRKCCKKSYMGCL